MKNPGLLDLYRAAGAPAPSAATDEFILAAARSQRARVNFTRPLLLLATTGLALLAVVRWIDPGATDAQSTDFGIAEGQAAAWLATFDPYTPTGPGSQEGLP